MATRNAEGCKTIIRRATLNDMDILLGICRDGFPLSIRWQGVCSLGKRWWRIVLESQAAETWVCLLDGKIAGFVVAIFDFTKWAVERRKRRGNLFIRLCELVICYKLIMPKILKNVRSAYHSTISIVDPVHIRAQDEKPLWIDLIAVALHARGKGIAKNMLRFCESRAIEHQRHRIGLQVDSTNKAACKLYERLGFICIGEKFSECVYTKMLRKSS